MREVSLSGFLQYGHLDVLCQYAGVEFQEVNPQLVTTHGLPTPSQNIVSCERAQKSGRVFLPWNQCPRNSKTCIPIGSPWLYFLKLHSNSDSPKFPDESERTLHLFVIPHSSTSQRYDRDFSSISSVIKDWLRFTKSEEIALLLHWTDFLNVEYLSELQKLNLPVHTFGYGGHANSLSAFNNSGGRHRFLHNIYNLLCKVNTLHLLEPSTLTYYSSKLGTRIQLADLNLFNRVYPLLYPETSWKSEKTDQNKKHVNFQRDQHKQLSYVDSSERIKLSSKILGEQFLHSQEELRIILTTKSSFKEQFKHQLKFGK
jgi:hypothetical protein